VAILQEVPMSIPRSLVTLALGLVVVVAACSSSPGIRRTPFDGAGPTEEEVWLTVENNDFRDATIHLYWSGVRARAGVVTGKTTDTFRMRWRSEWAYIEVDFLGGGGYRTETVAVYPGDHLNFVIMGSM
jgi:hypothetical protein